jgi:hypothetical protein
MLRLICNLIICYCLIGWGTSSINAGLANGEAGPIIGGSFPLVLGIVWGLGCGLYYMSPKKPKQASEDTEENHNA